MVTPMASSDAFPTTPSMTAYGTTAFVSVLFIRPSVSTVRPPSSTTLPPFIRSLVPFTIPVRSKFGRSCQIVDATLGVLNTATAVNWSGVTILNYCSHSVVMFVFMIRSAAINPNNPSPTNHSLFPLPLFFFFRSPLLPFVRRPPLPCVLSLASCRHLLRISSSSAAPRRKP